MGIQNIFQQALGASQKVFEYMDHTGELSEKPDAPKLVSFEKSVSFENISFPLSRGAGWFRIHSLSLEVQAGEVVALVGPSGGGKTSLANLVPRFYDVTGGAVRIDGRDVRDVNLGSLRAQIGLVAQDTFLFNDTVASNIAYGQPGVPEERIRKAADTALAHEFIMRLPDGYQTDHRRPRPAVQRRAAAAAGDRPRAAEERADSDSGRGDVASRHRIRDAGAEGAGQPDGASHRDRDCAPALDDPAGG